jgi:hypothetical protein
LALPGRKFLSIWQEKQKINAEAAEMNDFDAGNPLFPRTLRGGSQDADIPHGVVAGCLWLVLSEHWFTQNLTFDGRQAMLYFIVLSFPWEAVTQHAGYHAPQKAA